MENMAKFEDLVLNFLEIQQSDLKFKLEEAVKDIKKSSKDNHLGEDDMALHLATNRILLLNLIDKMKILEHLNVIKDLNFPEFSPSSVTSNLSILADYPLPTEQGFYELEYDQNGTVMRWTGPSKTFFFDLCFDRTQKRELTLKILSPMSERNVSEMKCFVDSHEIILQKTKQGGMDAIKAVLPEKHNFATTKISFEIPEVISPSEKNANSKDKRMLGVAFYELIIK